MAEIERLVAAGALVRGPKRLGPGPVLERRAVPPDGVGGVERVMCGPSLHRGKRNTVVLAVSAELRRIGTLTL